MLTQHTTTRAERAAFRLDRLLSAQPEFRHQLLEDWLQIATPGEVRRHWIKVQRLTGQPIPGWAAT